MEVEGVKTLFGMPDPSFFHMLATAELRGWQVIAPHHEQSGAFMAEALARMTGIPGVVAGNQGPGVANLLPAAVCAAKENSPVIFVGGQRQQIADQRVRRGRLQFIRQPRLFEEAMKYVGVIEYPEQTDDVVREAFRRVLSGTPGPAYIEVPMNAMRAALPPEPLLEPAQYRLVHQPASADQLAAAVALIREARNPILLMGHGVFTARAHDSVAALARRLQCPIIQTFPHSPFLAGLEDRTFPCGFSPAGIEAVSGSDLVIAIGTEIGEPVHFGTGNHWAKGQVDRKWIHIERDPMSLNVNRRIDAPLLGDLRDVVPQLVAALADDERQASPQLAGWVKAHADYAAGMVADIPEASAPVHPARLLVEATRAIPGDSVLVRDGGAINIFAWTYSQVTPSDVLWSQNFGHLGTGLPHAIGAQLAIGDARRAVLITGDSAFLFHISELETAVRKNLPVLCIVGCDYAWGLEVKGYRSMLGEGYPETEAHWGRQLRLDKIAEGFGAHGEYVERAEDIGPAIQRALASGKPAVIQVPIDGAANASNVPGHEEYLTWYTDFF